MLWFEIVVYAWIAIPIIIFPILLKIPSALRSAYEFGLGPDDRQSLGVVLDGGARTVDIPPDRKFWSN
jgi:hypothetical protein